MFISEISPGSLSDNCGVIHVGDQIVSINGTHLEHKSLDQVMALMESSKLVALVLKKQSRFFVQHVDYTLPATQRSGLNLQIC